MSDRLIQVNQNDSIKSLSSSITNQVIDHYSLFHYLNCISNLINIIQSIVISDKLSY